MFQLFTYWCVCVHSNFFIVFSLIANLLGSISSWRLTNVDKIHKVKILTEVVPSHFHDSETFFFTQGVCAFFFCHCLPYACLPTLFKNTGQRFFRTYSGLVFSRCVDVAFFLLLSHWICYTQLLICFNFSYAGVFRLSKLHWLAIHNFFNMFCCFDKHNFSYGQTFHMPVSFFFQT